VARVIGVVLSFMIVKVALVGLWTVETVAAHGSAPA
jgi:hypothetical protein